MSVLAGFNPGVALYSALLVILLIAWAIAKFVLKRKLPEIFFERLEIVGFLSLIGSGIFVTLYFS